MNASDPPPILQAIERLAPATARDIRRWWTAPLSDFAAHHAVPRAAPHGAMAVRSLNILARALDAAEPSAPAASEVLRRRLVLQAGPHCELPLDRHSFFAFWFAILAADSAGMDCSLAFTTSNVTLEKRSKIGPGWLAVGDRPINLFGLTRKVLSSASANTRLTGLAVDLPALRAAATAAGNEPWRACLELLGEIGQSRRIDRPRDFLLKSIEALWAMPGGAAPLRCFDEDVVSRAIELHLGWPESPLRRLLVSPSRHDTLLAAQQAAVHDDRGGFMRWSTDLFWGLRDGRLRRLRLADRRLVEPGVPGGFEIALTEEALARKLRDGTLRPNLFLVMVVLSILPRVTILGGPRQLGYYPFIQRVLSATLDRADRHEAALEAEMAAASCCAWGMCVIDQPVDALEALARARSAGSWRRAVGWADASLAASCRRLTIFQEHPKWLSAAAA